MHVKKVGGAVVCLIALCLSPSVLFADESVLPGAALREDLAILRDAFETLHPGYTRYTMGDEWMGHWDDANGAVADGLTTEKFFVEVSRLAAVARCEHTKANLSEFLLEKRNGAAVYLPFRFKWIDERMWVDVPGPDTALNRGDEVVSIDGRPVAEWVAAVEPLVSTDGFADHAKIPEIEASSEYAGGALDHFSAYLFDLENHVQLAVRRDGEMLAIDAPRITYADWQALTGEMRFSRNFVDAVSYDLLADDTARLAVDTFVNYRRPVDPVAHLEPFFERLRDDGIDRLVVDLRKNGGGSSDAQLALLRYLIREPVQQTSAILTVFDTVPGRLKPYLSTWNEAALNPDPAWFERYDDEFLRYVGPGAETMGGFLAPLPGAFDGDVFVLMSAANGSGVTHLLAALSFSDHVTLVGQKSGGAPTGATAGILFTLTLPNSGIKVRVPTQRTLIARADELPPDDGLEPEVELSQQRPGEPADPVIDYFRTP